MGDASDIPDPETPVGARGIGEPPVGAGACAVLNAISDALGDDIFRRAPVTLDMILTSLEAGRPTHRAASTAHIYDEGETVMAVIHDVMPAFELFQPASIGDAVALLNRHGPNAWVMAGGMDSFDWLKDRIKRPSVVIDLSQVEELARHQGARTAASRSAPARRSPRSCAHPLVREKFGLLAEAAELVASPQIRNQGTIGGNVSQDTRCWYYRGGMDVLPGRRQHLLCRHADGHQSRARDSRRRSLRGGEPVRHRAGTRRARRADGHPERAAASASSTPRTTSSARRSTSRA